jgi:peptidoglycan/LPS O-acetylase OafA/YrhL
MSARDALLGGLASATQTMTFYLPLAASVSGPLDVTWTLSVEWWFYLLWPILLLGLKRAGRTTTTVRNLSAVLACFLYAGSLGLSGPSFYYLPWSNTAVLLSGAAVALHGQQRAARPKGRDTRLSNRVGDTSLALLLLLLLAPSGMIGPGYRWVILPCTAGVTAVLLLGCADEGAARLFLSRPALRFLGIRAYSIYLWHFALLWLLQASLGESHGGAAVVVSLAALVPVVWISFRYLEQPGLRSESGSHVVATSRLSRARG